MVPKYLQDKEFLRLVDDLILEEDKKCYSDVDELDKEKMAMMAMSLLRSDAYVVITDSDHYEKMMTLFFGYIKESSIDNAIELASQLKTNAIDYFHDTFCELFTDRRDEIMYDLNVEAGLKPRVCQQTGETLWS